MSRLARFMGFGRHDPVPEDALGEAGCLDQDNALQPVDVEALREPIIAALRNVHDPEIPVNIYDLGLIYVIDIAPNGDVAIDMTLTAPACPVAGMMPLMVQSAVTRVDGVGQVRVELVWEPPWGQDNMSDEARLQLGLM